MLPRVQATVLGRRSAALTHDIHSRGSSLCRSASWVRPRTLSRLWARWSARHENLFVTQLNNLPARIFFLGGRQDRGARQAAGSGRRVAPAGKHSATTQTNRDRGRPVRPDLRAVWSVRFRTASGAWRPIGLVRGIHHECQPSPDGHPSTATAEEETEQVTCADCGGSSSGTCPARSEGAAHIFTLSQAGREAGTASRDVATANARGHAERRWTDDRAGSTATRDGGTKESATAGPPAGARRRRLHRGVGTAVILSFRDWTLC
jgi:hypothetical protein